MEESKDYYIDVDIDVLFRVEEKRRRKRRKIFGEGEYLFSGGEEKQRRKRRKIFGEDLSVKILASSFSDFHVLTCIASAYFLVELHMIKDGRLLFVKVHSAECTVSTKRVHLLGLCRINVLQHI